MYRKLARLLAVVMALVVPVQGMAALAAAQCMTMAHHQDAGAAGHAHEHDGAQADEHAHDSGALDDEDTGKKPHCGPCTSCCTSATIAGQALLSISSARSDTDHVFSQFPPLGVQPDGVYRPPLSL